MPVIQPDDEKTSLEGWLAGQGLEVVEHAETGKAEIVPQALDRERPGGIGELDSIADDGRGNRDCRPLRLWRPPLETPEIGLCRRARATVGGGLERTVMRRGAARKKQAEPGIGAADIGQQPER